MQSQLQFVSTQVTSALGQHAGVPRMLADLSNEAIDLQKECFKGNPMDAPLELSNGSGPFLAAALGRYRRTFVGDLERKRERAASAELIENMDAARKVLDGLLTAPWCVAVTPPRIPRVRDFLTPDRALPAIPPPPAPQPQMDDKFGILLSASQLPRQLHEIREACEERYAPVGVAFVDVDRLKELNTEFGETWVDSLILPPLMRAVEGATFGHGAAYRYGGDEFVLVLPSATIDIAHAVLTRLQADLTRLSIAGFKKSLTVSVGLCIAQPDAPLTDREVLHWAAMAKRKAKEKRNCIVAIETGQRIEPVDFTVLTVDDRRD